LSAYRINDAVVRALRGDTHRLQNRWRFKRLQIETTTEPRSFRFAGAGNDEGISGGARPHGFEANAGEIGPGDGAVPAVVLGVRGGLIGVLDQRLLVLAVVGIDGDAE